MWPPGLKSESLTKDSEVQRIVNLLDRINTQTAYDTVMIFAAC